MQGGVIAALVDTAMGTAAVTFVEGHPVFASTSS
jgi:acyl-coenzyme A thioesterase PaaI-like protein